MANWLYQKNGTTHGPIDSAGLKQLAQSGAIGPDDLLRRDDMQSWAKASKVNGLFPSAQQVTSPPPVPSPAVVETASNKSESDAPKAEASAEQRMSGWHSLPVVFALTAIFFPVGLGLIWTHPRWIRRTKLIWSGCGAVFFLIIIVSHETDKAAVREKLAAAGRQWDAGQKSEAVSVYRPLVEGNFAMIDDSDKPTAFQRVIEFDLASGSKESARRNWDRSQKYSIAVTLASPEGKQFLADLKAEEVAAAEKATAAAQASVKPLKLGEAGVAENLFSKNPKDDRIDFYDHPETFKGKLIEMQMNFGKPLPLGDAIEFYVITFQPQSRFELNIDIPDSFKVPKASHGDSFLVTFRCTKGELEFGNVAVAIQRK